MKLPLELSSCIVDLDEVAVVKYSTTASRATSITREQFGMLTLRRKLLLVTLRSGHTLDLREGDAAVFNSVFGKKVKEWVNEQVLVWRKQFEDNKDLPKGDKDTLDDIGAFY